MLTSLYTAISGMDANGTSLSVIGDNIANMNTVGFKESTASFGDVLSQTLTGASGSSQVGRGVMVSGVSPLFSQGSFETTQNGLDLAVDGDGLFMVSDGSSRYYTRDGEFSIDKNGNIVNGEGQVLQGYLADPAGNISGTLGNLQIPSTQTPANMTSSANVAVNLDSTSTPPGAAFTLDGNGDGIMNDPANYNYSNTITVYDSQGGAQQVTQYFVKTGANTWTVHYVHDNPATPGQLVDAGTQNLSFDQNGALVNDNSGTAISFNFGGSTVAPQAINFNYGTGTGETPAGTGLDGTTQFASAFSVSNQTQNGYSSGSLKNLTIAENGTITGLFTNGQTRAIGQVALARFVAPTKLTKLGNNLYAENFDSGQPIVGSANSSGMGRVLSNSLELSNVDLAQQFVKMISSQRGFEANSKIITTTDQMLQELVNLQL